MLNYAQRRCKMKRANRRFTNLKRHGAGERKEPMMPKTERSGFTITQGVRSAAVLKPRLPEAEDVNPYKEECLISTVNGTVRTCRCGIYHVQLSAMTLHLTPLQFETTSRLFKLAWGMVVGRRMSVSMSGLKRLPVVALLLATLLSWSDPSLASAATSFLVLAPDRGAIGNQETQTVFQAFKQSYPAEIALAGREYGGAPEDYSAYLSRAIKDLEANGATDIVAIPLFLSPIDPVLKKVQPRLPDPAKGSSIRWAAPMNESHLTAQILLDRLDALSQDPERERVVVLGTGATDAASESALRVDLERLTVYVARYRQFKEISVGVYYDREAESGLRDSKNRAVDQLVMATVAKKGTTLVVPFMIGPKFDHAMSQTAWLKKRFQDLDIVLDEQEIITHPNVLLWLKRTANQYLAASPNETGVVIMPHGSTQPYNDAVEATIAPLKSRYRIEMAYGMADPLTIQQAVSRLEAQGARRIAFIRLYALESHMRAISDYILGLSDAPPPAGHDHGDHGAAPPQVRSAALFSTYGGYEEDHRAIAEILHERIKAVSKDPAKETVILVAHGSEGDDENAAWLRAMNDHIDQIKKLAKPPFRAIKAATVREDWPEKREKAVAELKEMIKQGNRDGRVLLISNRLYGSGPYKRLLDGSEYVMSEQGFAPHPNLTRWLEVGIERTITAMNSGFPKAISAESGPIAVNRE